MVIEKNLTLKFFFFFLSKRRFEIESIAKTKNIEMSYVGELVGLRISARILDTGKNTAELYRFKTKKCI